MKKRTLAIVALLAAALVLTGARREIDTKITISQLPTTCELSRLYTITDGATPSDTATGGGSHEHAVVCVTENPAAYQAVLMYTGDVAVIGHPSASGARLSQVLETVSGSGFGGAALSTFASVAGQSTLVDINRSRSATKGTHTIVQSGDTLGIIAFRGSNGTSFDNAAAIQALVGATPGASSDMPGQLEFQTVPDNSGTLTTRMTINNAGRVLIGSGSTLDALLHVRNVASGDVTALVDHTGTTGTDNARLFARVSGGSGGDPITVYNVTGVTNWSSGVDNSESDSFIIANAAAPGTNNRFTITTASVFRFATLATAPGTCSIGDFYVDTSGAYCACGATNTWSNMIATGSCA